MKVVFRILKTVSQQQVVVQKKRSFVLSFTDEEIRTKTCKCNLSSETLKDLLNYVHFATLECVC